MHIDWNRYPRYFIVLLAAYVFFLITNVFYVILPLLGIDDISLYIFGIVYLLPIIPIFTYCKETIDGTTARLIISAIILLLSVFSIVFIMPFIF